MDTQCIKYLGSVKEFKHFIRAFIARAFPAVGIDMVHEQRYISLNQSVKGSPFGENIADKLMIFLDGAILAGRGRITIKNACG